MLLFTTSTKKYAQDVPYIGIKGAAKGLMGGNRREKKTEYGLLRQDNNDGLHFGSGQVTFLHGQSKRD
jgi:hypothetical protein